MTDLHIDSEQLRVVVPRALGAALTYFVLVFAAGCALGPIRVLLLEPVFGRLVATLIEGPFLIVAMIVASRSVTGWLQFSRHALELAIMGISAFALVLLADLAIGLLLFETSFGDQLLDFLTPAGLVYLLLLVIFAAMPLIVDRRRRS